MNFNPHSYRDHLKWALAALDLSINGMKYNPKVIDTDDPATCSTSLWNARAAVNSIKAALEVLPDGPNDGQDADVYKDALRYRWLKDNAEHIKAGDWMVVTQTRFCLDASIDKLLFATGMPSKEKA